MPLQEVLQQTPCSQKPDSQSAVFVQAAPGGFLPQLPPAQAFPGKHWLLSVHVARQFPSVPQRKGAQLNVEPETQIPLPSQVDARMRVKPEHCAAKHSVPAVYFRHAPAPSQKPSRPQVRAPSSEHSFLGS